MNPFRPDNADFPLLLHVAGAAIFFGAVAIAAVAQLTAMQAPEPDLLRRVAFRALLIVGLPAYVVFRVGAEWLYSKEYSNDPGLAWIDIGRIIADAGGFVFLIALILAGVAARKPKGWLSQTSGVLSAILVVALVIAVWAMGAKPT
jgi:hypothetical protein